MNELHIHQHGT